MSGLYIHIPFCKQACSYCDFHFSTNMKLQDDLVLAICTELEQRKLESNNPLETIYFGGGSPSILTTENLQRIFETIASCYDLGQVSEITLESNPDDHDAERLELWKSLGINRLSIGIQSFLDRDLKMMNRAHNAEHAAHCLSAAEKAGFNAFSLDLIYGVPNQSELEWQSNIERAISLNPQHISAYCLTIEKKTALHHRVQNGDIDEKSEEDVSTEFQILCDTLARAGYVHYEVSNFALPGHEAKHNGAYWSGEPYIGIGPSAHSFDGAFERRWNISNNAAYIKKIKAGKSYFESETLSEIDRFNEELMTGLRTMRGIDISKWPMKEKSIVLTQAKAIADQVVVDGHRISIPEDKWLLSDHIIRSLMLG